jgi:hypothetical protein
MIERRTHSFKAVVVAAGFAAVLAPLCLGLVVGAWTGAGYFMGPALLLGAVFFAPHVLLVTYCLTVVFAGSLSLVGARNLIFYVIGGMAVAWFSFVLSFPAAPVNSTADPVFMPNTHLAGLVAFGVAGVLDGIFYWLVASRITGCTQRGVARHNCAADG